MLLNIEIKIKVTNNGKTNTTGVTIDKDKKICEVFTALELARRNTMKMLEDYIKTKGKISESEFDKLYNSLTLEDLTKI